MNTFIHARQGNANGQSRITALDGWRGVSILLVICGHLVEYRWRGSPQAFTSQLADVFATLGVCIFFVISGLIITKLALREHDISTRFSASNFYIRRLIRIVPPLYVYLLFVLLLTASGSITQNNYQTLKAAAFVCNLPQSACGWFAGHSWSLAYEEQFYLLFPFLFILLGRHMRVVISFLFLILVGVPLMRYALHLGQPWFMIAHATFYFSFICAGSLVASYSDAMKRLCSSRNAMLISCAAVLLLGATLALDLVAHANPAWGRLSRAQALLIPALQPLCVAWLVGASVYARGWSQRVLNAGPLQFAGMISYSLYLWQQVFTSDPSNYRGAHWLLFYPLLIVCAGLSYYFVEQPCVRFAKHLTRPPARIQHPAAC